MNVLPRKMASAKGQTEKVPAQIWSFPAPVRGLTINENIATPQPGGARILDNWICTTTGAKVRGGTVLHSNIAAPVLSLFTYVSGATEVFFAASATDVYNITGSGAPPTAFSGQGAGIYATEQFGTAGGDYLYAVNGVDHPQLYDGANWNPVNATAVNELSYDALTAGFTVGETLTGGTSGATATILSLQPATGTTGKLKLGAVTGGPYQDNEAITSAAGAADANGVNSPASAVTITGVATDTFSDVWSFANRLFFVEQGTLNAWYLPVDSIGGAANSFSLAGIFRKGGALLFGGTWSLDAGDGLDDKCLFISDQGEVAVYEGTNPGSAADWRKVGVYNITRPLGAKATMAAGGDLLIGTEVGLVPISQAIQKDPGALELGSVSRAISPLWQGVAAQTVTAPWEIVKWPSENIMLVTQPGTDTLLCANIQTGAWSRFTGLESRCVGFFDGSVFCAGASGLVLRMESGGSDNTQPYTASFLGMHEAMGAPGVTKTAHQMRPTFRARTEVRAKVSVQMDYSETLSAPPNAAKGDTSGDVWDTGDWDVARWGGGNSVPLTFAMWHSIGRTGYAVAPEIQMTLGNAAIKPSIELAQIEVTYSVGGVVV
jgi:hypothetical protein